ncbi:MULTISPECIES: transcription-repair coupling factor [unclassified Neochlamydia]|uniref:transcription-repair coupling factor n=1 Tax=unclassified Neochlamydia TaxID=2643326 RepID=UPI001BC93DB0|nr:Transcription-repair-coupling factor [Neochlamydia sp. AcF65]MBS4170118.1 Transcription-repair-coupling factor [Neochlamydia sp. AcF95]
MFKEIIKSEKIQKLEEALKNHDSILIEETWNAAKAFIASLAKQATGKNILILTGASLEETRLYHDFPFFAGQSAIEFPAWETLPSENIAPSPDVVGERYKVLEQLMQQEGPHIILSGLQACLQRLIPPQKFKQLYMHLTLQTSIPFEIFTERLVSMGYQRRAVAADKGEFAIRGGIIDIFPVSSPDPFRLDFWGDEIESIRIYDPIGQKSIRSVEKIEIPPAKELELLKPEPHLCTLLDYLGPETIVLFDDILALEDRYASLVNICGSSTPTFCSIGQFMEAMAPLQKIFLSQNPIEELSEVRILDKTSTNYYSRQAPLYKLSFYLFASEFQARRWSHPFIPLSHFLLPEQAENAEINGQEILLSLSKLGRSDYHLHFLCATALEESNLKKRLHEANITLPENTFFHLHYLSSGFVLEDQKLIILPATEITHRYKIRRQKQRSTYHTTPMESYDLSAGELVVHLNNGIGKFIGLEKRPNLQGTLSEYFVIEYADNAKLFVPLNQAYLISKYIGANEEIPKLHHLGSSRWKKTKENTERAIMSYAADLLELYAKRSMKEGHAYSEDSPDMQAFEEDFPFVETEDQLAAIAAIKADMQEKKCMDRLICGDVGYGKTEVAMRAAFKAVVDGSKQVAVLVPTTVLAMQHYENFVERMSSFPINIAVLSRFRSTKQMKDTLEGIAKGSVDIVIGTHRLIGKDVIFKDLGLVIIDEEQRFGVKAKEQLKKIKNSIECLTLSATPIPRTLYMSLIGARDMSIINTPPQDRLPITTLITESNDETLKSALLRELSRNGQAYLIHNRVESIYEYAARLKKLLPHARIVVGHGQMSSQEIDAVFHAFKSGQADILVATTIVENGIDIPNANTILIDRADTFGLADLYQLRGRVGRWNRKAYAYFMVPRLRSLPELSRKRLNVLMEAQGYGGGMKIAMRDLEIRGAGNILGHEQSGQVAAIGFHLYCKLLKRTIQTLQGKISSLLVDTKMDFPLLDARLPEEFINEVSLRMEIYQRLGEAITHEEVEAIWEEIKDRFGKPPEAASWLYHLTKIRVYASTHGFTLLKLDKFSLSLEQQKGKQTKNKRTLIGPFKNGEQLESKVIQAMQEM